MLLIRARELDIKLSAESGQPLTFFGEFGRDGNRDTLTYPVQGGHIRIYAERAPDTEIEYEFWGSISSREARNDIYDRFSIGLDMKSIYSSINTDGFMDNAIKALRGMRITRNQPWETALCFTISQFNNIKRIRGIIARLSSRFGDTLEVEGRMVHGIPSPDALVDAPLRELRLCGTGFRDRYIRSVARAFALNGSFPELYSMPYDEAKRSLCAIDGIGDKVADCILLFGYGRVEAFPIDLWVKRVVENVYFGGKKQQIRMIHNFAENRWGAVRGYAQQYVFWHGRNMGIGKRD